MPIDAGWGGEMVFLIATETEGIGFELSDSEDVSLFSFISFSFVCGAFFPHAYKTKKRGKRGKIGDYGIYSSRAMSGGERGKGVATTTTTRAKKRGRSTQTTSSQTTLR